MMRKMWDEFLFAICRQPDGRYSKNETMGTLRLMWVCRICVVLMMVLLFIDMVLF